MIWLNRKRVWAETTRGTPSGVTQIPTNPSTTTGQQSKPNVSHRQFLISLSWAIRAYLASAFLSLAAFLGLYAGKEAWDSTLNGVSHITDTAKKTPNTAPSLGMALSLLRVSLTPTLRSPILNVKGILSVPAAFARFALLALGYSDTAALRWGLPWRYQGMGQSAALVEWRRTNEIARPSWMFSSTVRNFVKKPFHRSYQMEFDKARYNDTIICRFSESDGVIFGNRAQAKCYTPKGPFNQGGMPIDMGSPSLAPMAEGTINDYRKYTPWDL